MKLEIQIFREATWDGLNHMGQRQEAILIHDSRGQHVLAVIGFESCGASLSTTRIVWKFTFKPKRYVRYVMDLLAGAGLSWEACFSSEKQRSVGVPSLKITYPMKIPMFPDKFHQHGGFSMTMFILWRVLSFLSRFSTFENPQLCTNSVRPRPSSRGPFRVQNWPLGACILEEVADWWANRVNISDPLSVVCAMAFPYI